MPTNTRNYGIDLLRIVCMFSVVILHILGHGNVLDSTTSAAGFSIAWLWEVFAYPAVNCFVLISGFVGYRENKFYPKLKNIITLFFVVLFYSVTICLCFKQIYPAEIGIKNIIEAFLPITTKQYWFFSSYFAMFLVSPMLNQFVYYANLRMSYITTIVILILSVPSMVLNPFYFMSGYSFVWLVLLYVLGAMIKKLDFVNKISNKQACLFIVGGLLIPWLVKVVLNFVDLDILGFSVSKFGNILISYCSPITLAVAVGLVCIFSRIKGSKTISKVISFFTPTAFSVYLIHDNIYFRKFIISKIFTFINDCNPFLMFLIIPGCAIGVFIICSFADRIRILIFKLFRIEKLSEKLGALIQAIITKSFVNLRKIQH